MGGRCTRRAPARQLAELFQVEQPRLFDPRYNIAPTQPIPAVRAGPSPSATCADLHRDAPQG
ncbi:MAG TPA: hypothetical protein VFA26_24125, partial [Gemmataceae bacterium]|nr:hypothetical protein [Gemmataceae bacterium]